MSVPEVEEINISCEAGMEESFPVQTCVNFYHKFSLLFQMITYYGLHPCADAVSHVI